MLIAEDVMAVALYNFDSALCSSGGLAAPSRQVAERDSSIFSLHTDPGITSQSKSDLENQLNGETNPDRPRFGLLMAPKLSIYHDF